MCFAGVWGLGVVFWTCILALELCLYLGFGFSRVALSGITWLILCGDLRVFGFRLCFGVGTCWLLYFGVYGFGDFGFTFWFRTI